MTVLRFLRDPARTLAFLGAVLITIGCATPWYRLGTRVRTGLDEGVDGGMLLALSMFIAALATFGYALHRAEIPPARYVLLGFGVVAVGLCATAYQGVNAILREAPGIGTLERGLYLVAAGALLALWGGGLAAVRNRPDDRPG